MLLNRILSIAIIGFFAFTSISGAAPVGELMQTVNLVNSPMPGLNIPENLGTIEEAFKGTSNLPVVFIRNIPGSVDAQNKMIKLVEHLVAKQGVKAIFVGGYKGAPLLTTLIPVKNNSIIENTTKFFLEELRIGGFEYGFMKARAHFQYLKNNEADEPALVMSSKYKKKQVTKFMKNKKLSYLVVSPKVSDEELRLFYAQAARDDIAFGASRRAVGFVVGTVFNVVALPPSIIGRILL
jgi:hypothetical protein